MTPEEINEAADRLQKGEVVIYPTDTVFGIGCSIGDRLAIERVYHIKRRELNQPTHVLVSSIQMAEGIGYLNNPRCQILMKTFWPGPLTLVVPVKRVKISHNAILNENKMIGIRMPNHPDLLQIIAKAGTPILGPSANIKGNPAPIKRSEIDKQLLTLVDYVIGQESGGEAPSTIVEVTRYNWTVLREGPISSRQISKAVATVTKRKH